MINVNIIKGGWLMNLRRLVGKKVIRTSPFMDKDIIKVSQNNIVYSDEVVMLPDYSFCECDEVEIKVLKVVNDVPIVRIKTEKQMYVRPISGEYDDDNWKDVSDVYDEVKKLYAEQEKSLLVKNKYYGDYGRKSSGYYFDDLGWFHPYGINLLLPSINNPFRRL